MTFRSLTSISARGIVPKTPAASPVVCPVAGLGVQLCSQSTALRNWPQNASSSPGAWCAASLISFINSIFCSRLSFESHSSPARRKVYGMPSREKWRALSISAWSSWSESSVGSVNGFSESNRLLLKCIRVMLVSGTCFIPIGESSGKCSFRESRVSDNDPSPNRSATRAAIWRAPSKA